MADERQAYTSRTWQTGDVITKQALNKIENEMEYVSAEVTNAVTGTINDQKLNDTIARKLDSIVKYFPEEPTEENLENVRMYVKPEENNGEITVPTISDYQTFKANFVQPYTNKAYAVGDYVEYGDVIYKVISAITKNGNLTDDAAWTALTAQTPSPVREIDVMKEVNNLINVYTNDSQLTQEQNKIWIKQQGESVEVPTYEEFTDLKSAFELSGVSLFTGTCNYYNGSNTYTAVEIGQTNKISAIFDYVTATSGTRAVCQRRKTGITATTADTIKGAIYIKLKNENVYTKFNLRLASDPAWNTTTNHYLCEMAIYHSGIYQFSYSKQNIAGATWRYWYNIVEAYTDNIEAIYIFDNPDEIGKIFPQNATDALQLMDENPLKPLVFGGEWDGIFNGSASATWRANPPSYIKNTLAATITAESGVKGIVSAIFDTFPVAEADFEYALYIKLKEEDKRVQLKPVLSTNGMWGGTNNNRADGNTFYVTKSGFYSVKATAVYNSSNPAYYKYFLVDFVDYTQLAQIQNIEYIMVFPNYEVYECLDKEIVGKKWVGYGDSITEQGRWEYIIYNAFKLRFTNLGLGGSCVADVPNASVAGFCNADRIASIPADTDYITIMGGTNDFGQTADIGSIEALRTSFDRSTFMGALAYLIKAVQTQAPNARIIIMSNPNSRGTTGQTSDNPPVDQYGHSVYDFAKAARDVANYMSVDFIDVYSCGINTLNRTRYVDDTVHPNIAGGKLIGRKVLEFFSSMRVVD